MPGDQDSSVREQAIERCERRLARGAIEVDQDVATEDYVVRCCLNEQMSIHEVPLEETHSLPDRVRHAILVSVGRQMARAESEVAPAERLPPVSTLPRTRERTATDVDGVDRERCGRKAAVEEGDRDRVRLLAGRARNAQHPERSSRPRPGRGPAGEKAERLLVAEEPGLRNDDLLDQRLQLLGGSLEAIRERSRIIVTTGRHPRFDRELERTQSDRGPVETDASREQRLDARERPHGRGRDPSENASSHAGSTSDSS